MSLKKKNDELEKEKKIKFLDKLNIRYDFSIEVEKNYPYINYMNIHKFMDVIGIAQSIIDMIKAGSDDTGSIFSIAYSNPKPAHYKKNKSFALTANQKRDLYDIERDMETLKYTFQMLCLEEFNPAEESMDMNNVVNTHTRVAEKLEGLCISLNIPEEESLVGKSTMYMQAIPSNEIKSNIPVFY